MDVELRFFATFREAAGQKVLEREYPDGTPVGDVLRDLVEEYGMDLFEDGDLRPQLSIMKNGKDIAHLDGLDTRLEDGDKLSVFPPVAGGSCPGEAGAADSRVGESARPSNAEG